jgi:hypothetical protein
VMLAKALEVRDRATFIAVLAVDMNPSIWRGDDGEAAHDAQRYLLRDRCGHRCDGRPNIMLTSLSGDGLATNDPYAWPGSARTRRIAHEYIIKNWATLKDGDVVDVEHILGETATLKVSERFETAAGALQGDS